ncbi:MAG: hypothetical protein SOX77_01460 [Candidatus Borkfalkiaceae bacterium]|nr:hypothetical protein [Christensenellaceae bacterium]
MQISVDLLKAPFDVSGINIHLQGDEEAGRVFCGDNAEILNNANWQDVEKNH